jgi:predicted homoserine dehydrogenase-like protein
MVGFAWLRSKRSEKAGALELLGAALYHQAAGARVKEYAEPVVAQLKSDMAAGEWMRGLGRGTYRDLDEVVALLLAQ